MANWFVSDAGRHAMGGHVAATSTLTGVTASVSANTPGAWVQMYASTPFPASMVSVFTGNAGIFVSAQNSQTLFDIGIGPPTQQILIQNVAIGGNAQFARWDFPISVASGSQLWLRLRSLVGSKSCIFGMRLAGGGMGLEAGGLAVTYGAVQASSRGTILNTPTSTHVKASTWTVISAATSAPMRWLSLGLAAPNTATSTASNGLLDIGVGALGQETVIVPDIPYRTSTAEDILGAFPMVYPVNVPSGVRLVARHQASSTSAASVPNLTITGIC